MRRIGYQLHQHLVCTQNLLLWNRTNLIFFDFVYVIGSRVSLFRTAKVSQLFRAVLDPSPRRAQSLSPFNALLREEDLKVTVMKRLPWWSHRRHHDMVVKMPTGKTIRSTWLQPPPHPKRLSKFPLSVYKYLSAIVFQYDLWSYLSNTISLSHSNSPSLTVSSLLHSHCQKISSDCPLSLSLSFPSVFQESFISKSFHLHHLLSLIHTICYCLFTLSILILHMWMVLLKEWSTCFSSCFSQPKSI